MQARRDEEEQTRSLRIPRKSTLAEAERGFAGEPRLETLQFDAMYIDRPFVRVNEFVLVKAVS
jgi:hypothetical protein